MKKLVFVGILCCGGALFAEQGEAAKPTAVYVSTDPAVNALFDFFRKLYGQPEVSGNARYLADGLEIAQKNINRDIDLSRSMMTKLSQGLSRFNDDVSREVGHAQELQKLLALVSASFEARIRAIEDRKGIKRGIFS